MQFERKPVKNSEEHILPLINVVFLLLIFFMIAGKLSASDPFKVAPPESGSETPPGVQDVLILLGSDGATALDGEVLSTSALSGQLSQMIDGGKKISVRLKADGAANSNEVIELLEVLRDAGVEKLHLLTVQESE